MSMLAVMKERPAPGLQLKEVPAPALGHGDVLVKVHYASICGTDSLIEQLGPVGCEQDEAAGNYRARVRGRDS